MKSVKKIGVLVLISGFTAAAIASPCSLLVPSPVTGNVFNGPTSCAQGALNSAVIRGPLTMDGTTVKQDLSVQGPAKIQNATLAGQLKVDGPTTLKKTKVQGFLFVNGPVSLISSPVQQVRIHGPLYAQDSWIKGDVKINSRYLKLVNTQAKNITVINKNIWSGEDIKVYLTNHALVKGNIQFVGKKGTVYLSKGARIGGHIINGVSEQD